MFLNADTLTNKMAELKVITDNIKPDILCINEVLPKNFTRQIHSEEFSLKDYEIVPHKNVTDNRGRGSIIYTHL